MPPVSGHHCPVCHKVGNLRCRALGHYVECVVHPGNFYSSLSNATCTKCVNAAIRQSRIQALESSQGNKENAKLTAAGKKRSNKKPKIAKSAPLKTMKQLRREKKADRKSTRSSNNSCGSTTSENGDASE